MNRFLKYSLLAALASSGCGARSAPSAGDGKPAAVDPGPPNGLALRVATAVNPAAARMFDAWNGQWLGPAPPKPTPIISLTGSADVAAYLPAGRRLWSAPLGPSATPGSSLAQRVRLAGGGDGFLIEQENSWNGGGARSAFVPFSSEKPLWRRDDPVLAAEPDRAGRDWAVVTRGALVRFSPGGPRDVWSRPIPMPEQYGWTAEIFFGDGVVYVATWRDNQARPPVAVGAYAWDTGAPRWLQTLAPGKLGGRRPITIVDARDGRAPVIDRPLYGSDDIVHALLLDSRDRWLTAATLGTDRGEVFVLDTATGATLRHHLIALPR